MRRRFLIMPVTLLVSLSLPASEPSTQEWDYIVWINEVLKGPERHLENYHFIPQSNILSRVKEPNQHFLAYIQTVEPQAHPAEVPTQQEMGRIKEAISLLPLLHKRIINDRVIEICFIENLGSSGWTDWVIDDHGDLYCVVAFDQQTLSMDLSQWLESRENTCFDGVSEETKIRIEAGTEYSGFYGILLHEMTHVIDVVLNITPFVELSLYALALKQGKVIKDSSPFIDNVWEGPYTPTASYNFALRDSVTFYRPVGNRKLMVQDAAIVFDQLAATPFASLFACQSWAEDLAELVLFYHLTQKLDQPYTISVKKGTDVIYSYRPMGNPMVAERFPLLDMFYDSEN
ncbi:MAG: hypothetical protein JSW54_02325 [Fidelibacterota bacterium]|nr:MAG: hypothetical protein JSW54_02325 [Candidatus Neomarinimicrobiota bacterium]